MKIVLGLGNPGEDYARTRHNVGFRVLDGLAATRRDAVFETRPRAWVAATRSKGEAVLLVKPRTYMNRSGEALGAVLDALPEDPPLEDLLVVTDDVALPLGRMRFRADGSCGGHNGLASVEAVLASRAYPRLRIGVDAAEGTGLVEHVLGPFDEAEEAVLGAVLPVAVRAVGDWLTCGLAACQSRYNGWRPTAPAGDAGEKDPAPAPRRGETTTEAEESA